MQQIGSSDRRKEILDWYHLVENLHKVGGSNRRLRQVKNHLWQGLVDDAIAELNELNLSTGKELSELSS